MPNGKVRIDLDGAVYNTLFSWAMRIEQKALLLEIVPHQGDWLHRLMDVAKSVSRRGPNHARRHDLICKWVVACFKEVKTAEETPNSVLH